MIANFRGKKERHDAYFAEKRKAFRG